MVVLNIIDIYSSLSETYIDIKINEIEYIADKLIHGDFLEEIKNKFLYCTFSTEWI
jgi:hypothetical protein